MNGRAILSYVAHCLPAERWDERARLVRAHGLALEVAHGRGDDVERALEHALPIATIQAWALHEGHALSARPERARAGLLHLIDTIELARRAGVGRVLAVCGFGHESVADPFGRSLSFFHEVIDPARDTGVRVVLEMLGSRRAGAMTKPAEIFRLLEELDAPDVYATAVDTGHLLDAGSDPAETLAQWSAPLEELQLRGPDGAPPGRGDPLERWLDAAGARPPVVCVEHRGSIDAAGFTELIARLRTTIAR